ADLRDPAAPAAVVAAAVARFGRLDLLVNNAGATKRGDFLKLPDADWDDGFALKFFGAMRCCRAAWPHLRATRGAVVNVVGVGGPAGIARVVAFLASPQAGYCHGAVLDVDGGQTRTL